MSANSEPMSQDEDHQGGTLINLDSGESTLRNTMYIVHHVPQDQIDELEEAQGHEENQVEMNEFLQLKAGLRSKQRGRSVRTKIKKERDADYQGKQRNQKHFTDTWLSCSMFKRWLERHPSSNTKAICKVCNKVLLAGKSELLKHGASKKHQQFLQASTGWLKSDANSNDSNDNSNDVSSDMQTFDEEWLEDPLYKDWLSPHPDSPYKAFCKACNQVLLATKTDLGKHRTQKKHKNSMSTSGLETSIPDAMDAYEDHGDMTMGDSEYTIEETVNEDVGDENSETPIRVFQVKPAGKVTSSSGSGTTSTKYQPIDEITPQAFVTQLAPQWKGKAVVNGHVQDLKLLDFRGRYVVMFFYPQDFSTVCSTEILALGDVLSAFRVINCEIIAVSVDSHLAHLAWTKTLTATSSNRSAIDPSKIVPLLSDSTHAISKTYGCYLSSAGHSLRAYYIIDKRGYLRSMNVSDIQVGRNLKEILRQVEAFQLVDSTDTQCPVNWTTGQPSVKVAL
ncbi:hypothetical protein M8J76_008536 [Diaphorina citri]|nr:hypothetical protein M8J76_008536 [Diaphorina citri]